MRASDLISKKVYAIEEGCQCGYVLNFSLDKENKKLDFLVVASVDDESEMLLRENSISSISEDAVFVLSEKVLKYEVSNFMNNPIGKKVFSINGENLGKVIDVEIEKNYVKKIITSSCEILPKNIYSSGKDCLFFSKSKRKNRKEKVVEHKKVSLPYRQTFQGENLIGKKITKDIVDENHFLVFKKNDIVSPKIVIEAKKRHLFKALIDNSM